MGAARAASTAVRGGCDSNACSGVAREPHRPTHRSGITPSADTAPPSLPLAGSARVCAPARVGGSAACRPSPRAPAARLLPKPGGGAAQDGLGAVPPRGAQRPRRHRPAVGAAAAAVAGGRRCRNGGRRQRAD
eukprot:7156666-Prymnesium_polylepis.1